MQTESKPYSNYNDVINELQDYMLTKNKLETIVYQGIGNGIGNDKSSKHPEKAPKEVKAKATTSLSNPLFYPKEKDSLFWCYYIIKYGYAKYEMPDVTSFVNEKKLKFECIEYLRTCKQQLKTKKIKNIREDVEHDLANNQTICMKTFIALCIGNNINIIFIENRKCFEIIFDDSSPIYVVHCFNQFSSKRYAIEDDVTALKIEEYRNTLFKWESVEKPLKAISSYKLNELIDICKRFGFFDISLNDKTKKELYELILSKL
jgi:hypothetical protein